MNPRIEAMLLQLREMRLTPSELDAVVIRYADADTEACIVVHAAAVLLAAEVSLGSGSPQHMRNICRIDTDGPQRL